MAFLRKAFHKISHPQDNNSSGTIKPSPSTAALPTLSFQHEFGSAPWDGSRPITTHNSDSSISPSSKISLVDKDGSYRKDNPHLTTSKEGSPISPVSLASPMLDPLSSIPISIAPRPPPKGRHRRRQQDSSVEGVANIVHLPSFPVDSTRPSAVVDVDMTRRLEAAANQARWMNSESFSSLHVMPGGPRIPWQEDDDDPSIHVKVIDDHPTPSSAFVHSPLQNGTSLLPIPNLDGHLLSNGLPVDFPTQAQLDANVQVTLDGDLDTEEQNIDHQVLQNGEVKAVLSDSDQLRQDTDSRDNYDYSLGLIDDYAVPSTTPPPIPSSESDSVTRQVETLRLLTLRLAKAKARIDVLVEEKLQMVETHRREVLLLSDNVRKLEQKDTAYRVDIMGLVSENERVKADRDDVIQQLKYQIEENEKLEETNKELQKESRAFSEFKSKIRDDEAKYQRLFKEKDSWEGQLESMHQRLSDSERQVRCLDIITRQKYEAKQSGSYGTGSTVGRSAKLHFSPHVKGPSMDVITSVTIFNEEVLQTASYIVEHLEESESLVLPTQITRARAIWGSTVVSMLQGQGQDSSRLNILLLKNCLEVFMTHWCAHIVEGWYPKQPSFSDILVDLAAQTTNGFGKFWLNPQVIFILFSDYSVGKQQICGKQIKIIPTGPGTPDFGSWVKDVVEDLTSVLVVGGVSMPVMKTSLLPSKIEPLLKLAYNLRLGLAERDICGGLEVSAPPPDVPFHPQFMEDAEEFALQKSRKRNVESLALSWLEGEYIAGTNGIGLKRTLNGQPGVYEMVVKPKVSLIRVLEMVF